MGFIIKFIWEQFEQFLESFFDLFGDGVFGLGLVLMKPFETGIHEGVFGEFVDEKVSGELFELVVEDDNEL